MNLDPSPEQVGTEEATGGSRSEYEDPHGTALPA